MTTSIRWTIRGVPADVQRAVADRASATRRTVGEIVTVALKAFLDNDIDHQQEDRFTALEARLDTVETTLSDILSDKWQTVGRRTADSSQPNVSRARQPAAGVAQSSQRQKLPEVADGVFVVGTSSGKRLTQQGKDEARRMIAEKASDRTIAKTLGVSAQAINKLRKALERGTAHAEAERSA